MTQTCQVCSFPVELGYFNTVVVGCFACPRVEARAGARAPPSGGHINLSSARRGEDGKWGLSNSFGGGAARECPPLAPALVEATPTLCYLAPILPPGNPAKKFTLSPRKPPLEHNL